MSHEDEIRLQETEDEAAAYERALQATPEYWSKLCENRTADTISSGGRARFAVSGEITRITKPEQEKKRSLLTTLYGELKPRRIRVEDDGACMLEAAGLYTVDATCGGGWFDSYAFDIDPRDLQTWIEKFEAAEVLFGATPASLEAKRRVKETRHR